MLNKGLFMPPGWDEAVLEMRVGERATLDVTR